MLYRPAIIALSFVASLAHVNAFGMLNIFTTGDVLRDVVNMLTRPDEAYNMIHAGGTGEKLLVDSERVVTAGLIGSGYTLVKDALARVPEKQAQSVLASLREACEAKPNEGVSDGKSLEYYQNKLYSSFKEVEELDPKEFQTAIEFLKNKMESVYAAEGVRRTEQIVNPREPAAIINARVGVVSA